ncbi:MAG: hypothetical protein AAFY26_09410 [Cyanobacteria bacterium J06638_22]
MATIKFAPQVYDWIRTQKKAVIEAGDRIKTHQTIPKSWEISDQTQAETEAIAIPHQVVSRTGISS